MLSPKMRRSALVVAACLAMSLAVAGEVYSREGPRDGARSKVLVQKVPARNKKAFQGKRNASVEEEPFCVRPFDYPRQSR